MLKRRTEERQFVPLWEDPYIYEVEGDSVRTTEKMLRSERKARVRKAKGRKNFKESLVRKGQMTWKCLKKMKAKKRPLTVVTERPLMTAGEGDRK